MSNAKNPNTASFWDKKLKENFKLVSKSPIFVHKNKIVLKEMKDLNGELLDVGIGYGYIENLIKKSAADIKLNGIDISKFAIDNAKKKFKGDFRIGKCYKLPFKKRNFNSVIALDILEHLYDQELEKTLKEIYRVLKKEGRFVISVPLNENTEDTKSNRHLQKFTIKSMEKLLKRFKFKIIKKYTLYAFEKMYTVKSLAARILKIRKPNLLIIVVEK